MIRLLCAVAGGVLFGFGLAFSGMARPEVVLSFLQLRDLGLLLVMAAALAVLVPVFLLAPRLRPRTVLGEAFSAEVKPFHRGLIPGAVLFGLGWGLTGVCPGAAVASLGLGNGPILIALAGMLLGAWLHGRRPG